MAIIGHTGQFKSCKTLEILFENLKKPSCSLFIFQQVSFFSFLSWKPRERRPRFWGGAGEARADQNGVARRRIQYAMNFFKTD